METSTSEVYDVVGVGFGPSNLALAIALEEGCSNGAKRPINAAFFERQPSFSWHRNMLLPSTAMQVCFLKDLATFRNPTSRFTFVTYLHESGRLPRFVNNLDFFPSRRDFHQYLEWAAEKVTAPVFYGSHVTGFRLPAQAAIGRVDHVDVEVLTAVGARTVKARNVVVSTGLVPRVPDSVDLDDRVWHSSEFLARFNQIHPDELKSVAVVGAGQSAAEITRFLYDTVPHAQIYSIVPSYGYTVADATPFANQVFDASAVDDYYVGSDETREAFWRYHRNTNYSVVDSDVIRDLYRRVCDEDLSRNRRLHFLNLTRLRAVKRAGSVTQISLHSLLDGDSRELSVDAVVLATGYDSMAPTTLLGDLDQLCVRDASGQLRVHRDYGVVTTPESPCGLYLQGGTEHTHGVSSSLLSNIAVRSGEIADSIVRRLADASSDASAGGRAAGVDSPRVG